MSAPPKPEGLTITFEDDLVVVRLRGDYDLAVEQYIATIRAEIAARGGYRLSLMDVTEAGTVTREARHALVNYRDQWNTPGSLALVGASFTVRTLATMMLSAARMLTRRPIHFRFFATEEEGRAWLAKERERVKMQRASKP